MDDNHHKLLFEDFNNYLISKLDEDYLDAVEVNELSDFFKRKIEKKILLFYSDLMEDYFYHTYKNGAIPNNIELLYKYFPSIYH